MYLMFSHYYLPIPNFKIIELMLLSIKINSDFGKLNHISFITYIDKKISSVQSSVKIRKF